MWWWKNRFNVLRDPAEGETPAGGAAGDKPPADDKPDPIAMLTKQNQDLMARLAKLEGGRGGESPDLAERARLDRENREKGQAGEKALESAIVFNHATKDFWKNNAALLPSSINDLLGTADKERFDSAVEKASNLKSGIVQEFFLVQSNHDLLTASQKVALADYLKLTKNGRIEKAQAIYDSIFEPALERLRDIKKAEQVNRARSGFGDGTDDAYKQRLIESSKKHYLGEK